ncbi:MAG: rhomboid family intramembrane serine protease [Croceitalea sp.]|nr:rhomboid family intramembrane serine protease [Croceitalea sp.]MBT8239220.1 rhomboid family intramembrane serine protease [Croceitalea sp.]NNC33589.1 rhomboid family intramembrane serine protease [Croceitalea sp.]NNM17214.1 rhomboid family intramembrane serine protease [Croceitalea sp.]
MASGGLQYQFARLNIAEKLIAINVLIFILVGLTSVLFGVSNTAILGWFELPKDFFTFLTQPWSLVTYSFLHAGIGHIFWNMLMLYFAGRIFLNLFGDQRFINVYFLGVILGGLIFLLSYNVFPGLLKTNTSLIGASAGVTAVLIFVCAYIPNQEVRIIFFNVKLWYVGLFFVLIDLIQIPYGGNVGGRLAHLGGAFLGYTYARQLLKGKDIGEGFTKFLKAMGSLFKSKDKSAPLKTVYKKNKANTAKSKFDYDKEARQRKIDDILDKISKSGYESLSKAEKDFLFKAGKED